ncbi:hypothetical protein V1503_19550 [Bacillus sp. SCS-151]|uniref:hypothetical protein n=1 Tax=Nanhaiella sioensis TaxID=3115293 RepID=UPI00397AB133
MRSTIDETKQERLKEWLEQLESELIELHSHLEDHIHVTDNEWKSIDQQLSGVNRTVVNLKEEVEYA